MKVNILDIFFIRYPIIKYLYNGLSNNKTISDD